MSNKLIGTKPNQVPTNADLGEMAYQNNDDVTLAAASKSSLTVKRKDDDGDLVKLKRDVTTAGQLGVYASGTGAYLNGTSLLSLRIAGGDMLTLTNSNLYPTSDSGVNLGLSNRHFNNLHMSGTAYIDGGIESASYSHLDDLPDVRPSLLLDFANSKTLDPRITFTRGSTATYWDGKTTTKAEENLARYTDDFTTIYTFEQVTITRTDTAPDGTASALRMTETTANTDHRVYDTITYPAGANTTSVYAKYVDRQYLQIRMLGGGAGTYAGAVFDIQNGTVTSTNNVVSTSITSVSNGWYRLSVTANTDSNGGSGNTVIAMTPSSTYSDNAIYAGTGAEVLIWGLQVENRSSATAYTPTTSSPIVKYQPTLQTAASGEARFDHDPVTGESKGLLIEGSRTNLANWSEVALNFYGGNLSGAEMYANAGIAPDGTHTADLVHQSTLSEHQSLYASIGGIGGSTTYTRSCYFKSRGARYVALMQYDGFSNYGTTYDLQDGVVVTTEGSATGAIEDVGNGWFRCSQTHTTTAAATSERIQIALPSGGNNTFAHTGDGWSGVLFWGWQLEVGGFPTSYIKTSGSTVTRANEVAEMTGTNFSSWYNHDEMSFYAEHVVGNIDPTYANAAPFFFAQDTSTTNLISVGQGAGYGGTSNRRNSAYIVTNNVTQTINATSDYLNVGDKTKIAFGASNSDGTYSLSADTQTLLTGSVSLPYTINKAQIGKGYVSDPYYTNGWIKKIAFYQKRLSNATLQAMTEE